MIDRPDLKEVEVRKVKNEESVPSFFKSDLSDKKKRFMS